MGCVKFVLSTLIVTCAVFVLHVDATKIAVIREGQKIRDYKNCDQLSVKGVYSLEIDVQRKHAEVCCCMIHLYSTADLLQLQNLQASGDKSEYKYLHNYTTITSNERSFNLGITSSTMGRLLVKQGGHNTPSSYEFSERIKITGKIKWLNCSSIAEASITSPAQCEVSTTTEHPGTQPRGEPPNPDLMRTQLPIVTISIVAVSLVVILIVIVVIFCLRRRQLKGPQDSRESPHAAVYVDEKQPMEPQITSSVMSVGGAANAAESVEYAAIDPTSLVPRSPPPVEDGKAIVYADLAFQNNTANGVQEHVEANKDTIGKGMSDDEIALLYAKPMKRQ